MKSIKKFSLVALTILAFAASTGVASASAIGLSIVNEAFHAEKYPSTIAGEQTEGTVAEKIYNKLIFNTKAGQVSCSSAKFSSTGWAPSGLIADADEAVLTPTLSGCTLSGLTAVVSLESGCWDTFNVSGLSPGGLDICAMTVEVKGSPCVISVPTQMRSGLEFSNVGSGSSSKVEVKLNTANYEYQVLEGKKCPNKPASGTYTDGTYKGVISLGAV